MSSLQQVRRILKRIQTCWSIAGVSLVLVLLVECGLRGMFWLKDLGKPRVPPDPRVMTAIPESKGWLPVHYRELEALSDRWRPYVYFRQRPFHGQTIHIDQDGLRATWQPPGSTGGANGKARALRILMLGGSSLWGFGARDDRTIPSLTARGLHERGVRAEIRNLSEIGYVSTQEVIALLRELQRGYRPDVVLFYDGVNDTTSALLEKQSTVTTNEINRVREFNLFQSPARLTGALAANLVSHSASFRLAQAIGGRLRGASGHVVRTGSDVHVLAEAVVAGYRANLELVRALGKSYAFRTVFVWQPDIFSKSKLVPFEEEEAAKFEWARSMFLEIHELLAKDATLSAAADFQNLTGLFKDRDSLVFLDFCHTTEAANAEVAKVLMECLLETARPTATEPAREP
jgi:hypothetical protein